MSGILGHLERLGGMLVRPRATVAEMLFGEAGRAWPILAWLFLLDATLSPGGAGRAILVMRVDVLDGLFLLLNGFTRRMAVPLVVAVGSGVVLAGAARRSGHDLPLDRAFDVSSHLLVPFLAVSAASVLLAAMGWGADFLPHLGFRGAPARVAPRAALAFAGSFALLVVALRALSPAKSGRDE